MSVGAKVVVSKRSARPYVEDGMEKDAPQYLGMRMTKHEQMELEDQDRKSRATSQSSQTSLESSPMVQPADGEHEVDALSLAGQGRKRSGSGIRDAFYPPTTNQHLAYPTHELEERLPVEGRPANFGVVVPGVYRSSFPQSEDYAFIEGLKLKTIVTLVQKDFPQGYDAFLQKNGIRHCVFDMKGTKKEAIPINTMKSILSMVLDRRNHPLLIHCNHGKHRTGCVVAIVRKLSGWDLGNIISEYKTYAEPKVRECDVNYITTFELADISNLFREAACPFRIRTFLRSVMLALLMVAIWVFSGSKIASTPKRKLLK